MSELSVVVNQADPPVDLQEALRCRERELELLKETALAVGNELDLDRLLQIVAERARELIQAEYLLIPIVDVDSRTYTYRAGTGLHAAAIVGETLPLEEGLCGWMWRQRRSWWRGVLPELDTPERNRWERDAHALILVPLIGNGRCFGGLAGINKQGGGDFSQGDLDLLGLFASQVGIAILNAMAYADLARAKTEAESYQIELRKLNTHLTDTNKELEYLALYDQLTGLPNRSLLQDRLQQALRDAERSQRPVAVMLIDLDLFKEVNDTLGHDAGDQLLREVSERFANALRISDTVGRLGGDEFVVIVPGADAEAAILVARSLLAALDLEFTFNAIRFNIAASIGIAVYPSQGSSVTTLLKHADAAMYVAKRTRFGCSVYDEELKQTQPCRLTLSGDLRQALANRDFELYYQPKVDLRTGRLFGVEALSRWPHPRLGFVVPESFIAIMEQTGLIRPYTLWVLERSLQQSAEWLNSRSTWSVSVNLSMQSLLDPQFPEQLLNLLQRNAMAAPDLTLEITESVFLSEHAKVRDVLIQLRRQGVRFSIDDFGVGHSSLSRLKRLPVSELKIDRSFVKDMLSDPDAAIIVRSTIDLAHNLGLEVIAEGVESEACLQLLRDMGCDMAQGNYISRPLPADEFIRFLDNTRWIMPGGGWAEPQPSGHSLS